MKRSASLLVVAMVVGVLGVTGCQSADELGSEEDGAATVAAVAESPATQAASAAASPAAVAASHVAGERRLDQAAGRAAGFFGRTTSRFRGAFERWERRREMERERRLHQRQARERRQHERRPNERRERRRG